MPDRTIAQTLKLVGLSSACQAAGARSRAWRAGMARAQLDALMESAPLRHAGSPRCAPCLANHSQVARLICDTLAGRTTEAKNQSS